MLKGKKIILGITGSIAAYKACYIIRGLIRQGAEVQVVITPAGKEFITPITLSALTSKPVISEFFAQRDGTWNSHVDLGLWADAMLIAPATASTIGKMANGIADNMLITTYLSAKAPVFVAPAMDLDMYAHPSTQKNLDILRSFGNHIIEPGTGELASHLVGKGRMEEPENIIRVLDEFFAANGELKGKKVMITAGPTYEKIDPVRFIGNYSSGKMGFALAEECARRGAEVTLIAGPVQLETRHSRIGIGGGNVCGFASVFLRFRRSHTVRRSSRFPSGNGGRQEDQARERRRADAASSGNQRYCRQSGGCQKKRPVVGRLCPRNEQRAAECRRKTRTEEFRFYRAQLSERRGSRFPS